MQALSLRTNTGGTWDGEGVVTYYNYLHDRQLSPSSDGFNFSGGTAVVQAHRSIASHCIA